MALKSEDRPKSVVEWLDLLKPTPSIEKTFFDTVKVNDRGYIIKKESLSAQYFTSNSHFEMKAENCSLFKRENNKQKVFEVEENK